MGLAASQVRLLTLTQRKASVEYEISRTSMDKQSLTREMTDLARKYQSKLQAKNLCYYNNNSYHKLDYGYLMGYGVNYSPILNGNQPLKKDNSMILTDRNGLVVLSDSYANAIVSVLGASAMDRSGRGSNFSIDSIADILNKLTNNAATKEEFLAVIDGKKAEGSYASHSNNMLTGETVSTGNQTDNTDTKTEKIKQLVDFYYPIFAAAATNGWTTEYNNAIKTNTDYVSDALITGFFQLESVDCYGLYDEGTSLTYFITNGAIEEKTTQDDRAEIQAWYDAELSALKEKEDTLDLLLNNLSTELNIITTEIKSIQSFIKDAVQGMSFGNS
ncbi:MAG: hypothetical protein Q4E83_06000 [bacterium]|nr:hypothetical protein [bacterium]